MNPKYPDVKVKLVGEDGNVFNLVGLVSRALKRAGYADAVPELQQRVMACKSYDEALVVLMETVEVE